MSETRAHIIDKVCDGARADWHCLTHRHCEASWFFLACQLCTVTFSLALGGGAGGGGGATFFCINPFHACTRTCMLHVHPTPTDVTWVGVG